MRDNATKEAAEFNFGYLYREIEEHINNYTAQPGCPYTGTDITLRICKLLSDKILREAPGSAKLVSKVFQNGLRTRREGTERRTNETVYVRSRDNRSLTAQRKQRLTEKQNGFKRQLTRAQLIAVRANAVKARAALHAKVASKSVVPIRQKSPSTDVRCGVCNRHFPSRSAQMKHRVKEHGYKVSNAQAA